MSAYSITSGDFIADSSEIDVVMKDSVENESDNEKNFVEENIKKIEDEFGSGVKDEKETEEEYSSDDSIFDYSSDEEYEDYDAFYYDEENGVAEDESAEDMESNKEASENQSIEDDDKNGVTEDDEVVEVNDESAEDMEQEESENESIEDDDENASENEMFSYDEESISDDSNDEKIDYSESELPNINFPKLFVIPRVPGSDFSTVVLKYLKKNSPPQTALKLMQICKYFCYEEFPFLPMKYLRYYEDYGLSYETLHGQEVEYADPGILKIFKKKLWMTDEIFLDYSISIDFFLPYIAACSLKKLYFQNMNLSIDQLKFLTFGGKIKKVYFRSVSVNYENGNPVPLEEILKCMPNIKEFSFKRSSVYHENVSAIIPFLNPTNLNFFALGTLTENFDFETFITCITEYPKIQFSLKFKKSIPIDYFKKLENFVENIRKSSNYSKYVFSRIYCKNQNWEYNGAVQWYELPTIYCLCKNQRTLHSNYKPPYFHCRCKKFYLLKNPEFLNKQLSFD